VEEKGGGEVRRRGKERGEEEKGRRGGAGRGYRASGGEEALVGRGGGDGLRLHQEEA
jgi:hypothetical protein